MKKMNLQKLTRAIFLSGIFILSCMNASCAQQRISIGPRIGVNLSDMVGDNISHNRMYPGWSVGGFIMYSDINHFGISGDVLFSQKGSKFENRPEVVNNANVVSDYNQRINYLEIPVLARYFLNKSGNFRPNLFIGPSLAFKLNAKKKEYTRNDVKVADEDNSDQFSAANLGVTAGVALNFQVLPSKRILIDARYTYGLNDVMPKMNGMQRNSTVTLNAAYGFGLGKKFNK